jgi:hypothetical protein
VRQPRVLCNAFPVLAEDLNPLPYRFGTAQHLGHIWLIDELEAWKRQARKLTAQTYALCLANRYPGTP